MYSMTFNRIAEEVDMLSYSERLSLLERIVKSFGVTEKNTAKINASDLDCAFGIWSDSDINVESVREKAWNRGI